MIEMGRKLMRVPLDFGWKLKKVWKGYSNPYYKECPDCENGYTEDRRTLSEFVRNLMFHSGLDEITGGLAGRPPREPFGHDTNDNWNAEKNIIKAAGLNPEEWGICKTCNGEAIDPKNKKQYEEWDYYEPPKGKGFQLWETTSEGSPESPVFETIDELCKWCEENATTFGSSKTTKERWKEMLLNDNVHHTSGSVTFI